MTFDVRFGSKMRRTHIEHMSAGLPSIADIPRRGWHGRKVPRRIWWEAIRGFLKPAAPPAVITASQIGALAGFTALASGLNW